MCILCQGQHQIKTIPAGEGTKAKRAISPTIQDQDQDQDQEQDQDQDQDCLTEAQIQIPNET